MLNSDSVYTKSFIQKCDKETKNPSHFSSRAGVRRTMSTKLVTLIKKEVRPIPASLTFSNVISSFAASDY